MNMKARVKPSQWLGVGLAVSLACPGAGFAADATEQAITDLQKQVEKLQQEIERLKAEKESGQPAEVPSRGEDRALLQQDFFKAKGLSIGFYGEAKYRFPEKGSAVFDPHRFVLTPSYQINDWLFFNSEVELEHGGVDETPGTTGSGTSRSKFDGELELEQFYVDILIDEHFNVRSPGIDLMPIGRINPYHEPTVFYSVDRPQLYRQIIPSTWFEPSMSVFGKITDTLDYKLQVSTGMEDRIRGSTAPGITGGSGMRGARPRLRRTDESDLAYSARLSYKGIPGLDTSTSFYITQVEGFQQRNSTIALWDIEALYRIPRTDLELRGDFAYWHISSPENLLANNDIDPSNDVGDRMFGYYVEAAYHFWPEAWRQGKGAEMDLVPFVRYSDIRTQSDMPSGTMALDDGSTNRKYITTGVSYFLNRNFVVKADWNKNLENSEDESFQLGAGVFF